MLSTAWLLLLPIAATFGYLSGQRKRSRSTKTPQLLRERYAEGLRFLLNEDSDKATQSFIKLLEVNGDTVETHFALGSLFRRRGEVDRAIRIHQNLVAKPDLASSYRAQALLALAQDYLSAGVLDRAEGLFLELLEQKIHIESSARGLLYIYQQEKEWRRAIEVAEKYHCYSKEANVEIAHYYCELAEIHTKQEEMEKGLKLLRKALGLNPVCVRARLHLAYIQIKRKHYRPALRHLCHIREKTPDWALLVVPKLQDTYLALGRSDAFLVYLQALLQEFPSMPILNVLADNIRQVHGDQAALHFVVQHLRAHPSLVGLSLFLNLSSVFQDAIEYQHLTVFYDALHRLSIQANDYRCYHCGFSGSLLHWQCPSCKRWESVKPAYLTAKIDK